MTRAASSRSASVIVTSRSPRRIRVARARTSSGAPLVFTTRQPSWSSIVVMSLSPGSKRNNWRRRACRPASMTSAPQLAASSSSSSSVGSPAGFPPGPSRSPLLHAATPWASRDSTPPAPSATGPVPGTLTSTSGVHTVLTRILFSVRVPVLSVQMTEVDPRVSTADSRLTRAPRRAISRTPTASARVIVGSSLSGTLATSSPIAKLAAAATLSPAARPIGRNAIPAPTATNAIRTSPGTSSRAWISWRVPSRSTLARSPERGLPGARISRSCAHPRRCRERQAETKLIPGKDECP